MAFVDDEEQARFQSETIERAGRLEDNLTDFDEWSQLFASGGLMELTRLPVRATEALPDALIKQGFRRPLRGWDHFFCFPGVPRVTAVIHSTLGYDPSSLRDWTQHLARVAKFRGRN